jgi:hypothetical protein
MDRIIPHNRIVAVPLARVSLETCASNEGLRQRSHHEEAKVCLSKVILGQPSSISAYKVLQLLLCELFREEVEAAAARSILVQTPDIVGSIVLQKVPVGVWCLDHNCPCFGVLVGKIVVEVIEVILRLHFLDCGNRRVKTIRKNVCQIVD